MKRLTDAAPPVTQGSDQAGGGARDLSFSSMVVDWQRGHGRHALPWQQTRDPYRIWLSEIMLQQTQVSAVIPYYERFLAQFPDVKLLAQAPASEVMSLWSGLGYYTRARNLHRCAQVVSGEYEGSFPSEPESLAELPGIGRSTAAAIAAFAFGRRAAILDGNVKRVFCRVFGIDAWPGTRAVEDALWDRAEALLPDVEIEPYTQGLMDLGATLCTRSRPQCGRCPLAGRCVALATDRVTELPVRKPSKAIPQRHAVMLVVEDGGQVLLEQRPPSGIWGGLLSLPELPQESATSAAASAASASYDAMHARIAAFGESASVEPLPPFTHGFTHFKLHVVPYRVRLEKRRHMAGEWEHQWVDTGTLANAPLPAPVKKLLMGLYHPAQQAQPQMALPLLPADD
ncbi:MAG: mutY [Herminiimonas sp.]|nr:mutY [Herminiimonas sp.]